MDATRTDLSDTAPAVPGDGGPGVELESIIDGRYRVLSKIGEGGMGAVYRVEHVRMGKIMALKLLRSELALRKRSHVERFRREAQVVSKLDHPNIITVFDAGETPSGELYLVMEYVPGWDLAALVREEKRVDSKRAVRLVIQILKGLAEAHGAGIIHRDIKPANIMLANAREQSDFVKILDFGIAKLAASDRPSSSSVTGVAEMVGTPSYMSPEQARGLELDPRSDLYSVSAVLFELIAGRGPFVGTPLEVVSQHLVAVPPKISAVAEGVIVSETIDAVIAKGLSKDPAARFQSAEEMRRALENVLGAPAPNISHVDTGNIARREDWDAFENSFRRQHFFARAFAVLALIACVATAGYAFQTSEEQPPPPRKAQLEEQEPNDKPNLANLIELGKPVRGHIGVRTAPGLSDRDMYELLIVQEGIFSLAVSAVPNVNLVIEVFRERAAGELPYAFLGIDDAPASMPEELTDVKLEPGHYWVRLEDRRRLDEQDGVPRENSTDAYTFSISRVEPREFQEVEPNNEPEEAMAVDFSRAVLGKGGAPGVGAPIRSGNAPLPTWSTDHYKVAAHGGAREECAILGGAGWSALRLSLVAPRAAKPKSVTTAVAREGRAAGVCMKAADNAVFEVRVEEGNTGATTYPIAVVGDHSGGFLGLLELARALAADDRTGEAVLLVDRALDLLPKAADAGEARAFIAQSGF